MEEEESDETKAGGAAKPPKVRLQVFQGGRNVIEEKASECTEAILNLEEYDDESASLLQDFGFGGNFASWTREMTESAGFVGSAFVMLLVVLSLASSWSSTAGSMCFALVKVVLILACLSGFCMHQLQPVKASPEASPYTTEGASS